MLEHLITSKNYFRFASFPIHIKSRRSKCEVVSRTEKKHAFDATKATDATEGEWHM